MKNLNKILIRLSLLLVLGFIVISCDDITTENNTTTASFNTFDELVQGRLSSVYASLRSNALYRQAGIIGTWSDSGIDTYSGTLFPVEYNPYYAYTYGAGSLLLGQTWKEFYTAIKQINSFLGQIESFESSTTEEERNPVIAEARFLRGLLYFDMVKIWGDIPLVLSQDLTLATVRADAGLPNSTAAEVYLQIIEDLKYAKENGSSRVGASADIASREAAQALLGKVYLQMTTSLEYGGIAGGIDETGNSVSIMERFTMAEVELRGVINSGSFALEPNYGDIFSEEGNDEVIFAVGYDGPNNSVGSDFGDFLGRGNNKDGGAFGAYRLNIDFAFEYLRPDGLVDADGSGETISGSNLLLKPNPDFIESSRLRFRNEVGLLGATNFVADERFDQNVVFYDPLTLAQIARGERTVTEAELFNILNPGWFDWSPSKYIKPTPNPNNAGDGVIDFPFLRYADVLLMEAEALNALGRTEDARNFVNMVIKRSIKERILKSIPEFVDPNAANPVSVEYRVPTENQSGTPASILSATLANNLEATVIDDYLIPSGLSQDEMLDRIVLESSKELCFEGKRKDDLIRTGKLAEIINKLHRNSVNISLSNQENVKASFDLTKHTHWPIPQEETSLNPNLKQNCEYGSSSAGCF